MKLTYSSCAGCMNFRYVFIPTCCCNAYKTYIMLNNVVRNEMNRKIVYSKIINAKKIVMDTFTNWNNERNERNLNMNGG